MPGVKPSIVDLVLAAGSSVAVVGMAKNCGKTVTLGAMLRGLAARGIPVGVASAGRDGEEVDAVTMLPKPPVTLPAGALFATAESLAPRARARIERLAATCYVSALGRLTVYRTLTPGGVEVSGGTSIAAAREAVATMRRLGARFVAIDGAAARRFSCAPQLAEAAVLATGAALAETVEAVARRSAHAVRILTAPRWTSHAAPRAHEWRHLTPRDVLLVSVDGSIRRLHVPSVLLRLDEIVGAVLDDTEAVVVGGALTSGLLRALAKKGKARGLTVVVRDSTKILADVADVERFWSAGGRVAVVHPIKLVAVTANPVAPDGRRFDPAALLDRLADAVSPVPTFDVLAGAARVSSAGDGTGAIAS